MPDRRHAFCDRRAVERDYPVAAIRRTYADKRTAPQHSRHYRKNVDPASSGVSGGRDPGETPEVDRSSLCALFDLKIWTDAVACSGGDLRVGTESSEAKSGCQLPAAEMNDFRLARVYAFTSCFRGVSRITWGMGPLLPRPQDSIKFFARTPFAFTDQSCQPIQVRRSVIDAIAYGSSRL